ncbi:MAG: response regulator [Flavobacteriaceae bacterium]|nr:response regulator [Flavobacteriaceae bacterium]
MILIGYLIYQYYQSKWRMKLELQVEHDKAERLKKLHEYKTKLYTNLSHEFRTPLSLIIAPVNQLLSENQFSTGIKNKLNMVQKNAQHLLNMSNQLLDLSKVESGFTTLKVSRNQLDVFIESQLENFESLASEKNITINYTKENLGFGWFDHDVLQKIISNLMSNAVKYSPANSMIDISCKKDSNERLIIIIRNIFTGLKPRNIQQLFERFYQAHWDPKGFGIGLSLVKELIHLHKGEVKGNFIEPNFIQFEVDIPVDHAVFNSESNNVSPLTNDIEDDVENENIHDLPLLLIVDDHDDMRKYIKSLFESDFKIIEATNGKEGITLALEQVPNIIVSDIMMPEIDGATLCKTLKNEELTSHIPILLLTAQSGNNNELEGLKTGADDYISKPFSHENLKQRVLNQYENQKRHTKKFIENNLYYIEKTTTYSENNFFNKVNQLLEQHCTVESFDVNFLCKELGVSRMQLHRKMKALTNDNTSTYIKNWRLMKALRLLENKALNTSELAFQVGFNSSSYFIKCFKEKFGKTPKEMRGDLEVEPNS